MPGIAVAGAGFEGTGFEGTGSALFEAVDGMLRLAMLAQDVIVIVSG
jgi:hypothetical protein